MKAHIYLATVLLLMLCSCKKDRLHWQSVQQLDGHTDARLNRIVFISDKICLVSGGEKFLSSVILRSADGGNSWTLQSYPDAGKGLYGFAKTPSNRLYACGFDGKILYSADSGASFSFKQLNIWKYNVALAFPEDDKGIMIGTIGQDSGFISRINAAADISSELPFGFGLNDVKMADRNTGYACGMGALLRTTDGGGSWSFTNAKGDNFTSLYCLDAVTAWVCGYNGSILKTADGGNNWVTMRNGNDPTLKKYRLMCIAFADAQNGYAAGDDGVVLTTDDGGEHWMEFDRFTSRDLTNITVAPDGSLLVCGAGGALYKLVRM